MICIEAKIPLERKPKWAVLERELIDVMNEAYKPVMMKYVRSDGSLLWPVNQNHSGIDALDDAYESFHNWPLFYILGGSEKYLALSLQEFDAITKQFSHYDSGHGHPMIVKEYEQGYDWFHQGEGYLFFYLLCMAAPDNAVNKERAVRFAGFYRNEDPDALNFDEELLLVKAPHTGSKGPAYRNFDGCPWHYEEWKTYYGLPFLDIPGCSTVEDLKEPDHAAAMGHALKERASKGDVPVNLAVTSMMTNAFLMTGEMKYQSWVKDYVKAWMGRTERNGGIIPDNIGLGGGIGEYNGGKWYGGYYGWTWPHGWGSMGDAVTIAAQNAALLEGDMSYLELLRSQLEVLIHHGIEHNGTLMVPYKHGDPGCYRYTILPSMRVLQEEDGEVQSSNGWFEFQAMDPKYAVHLWNMSELLEDWDRIGIVRNYEEDDWLHIHSKERKDQGGHEAAWAAYLNDMFPQYPEQILQHNLDQARERLELMRNDKQDPSTYRDWYLQARNPISVEGLTQLTMGGPLPAYNGGLLMTRLRYFDAVERRPGLPKDIAALVEKIEENGVVLQLVHVGAAEARTVIVQGGAFAEHSFHEVKELKTAAVGGSHFAVKLWPNCGIRLHISFDRYCNQPVYSFPDFDQQLVYTNLSTERG